MYNNIAVKVSIVIPTYNSANTLSRCLQSIVSQTYINFEVLCIDGLSTDQTLNIITEYQKSYQCIKCISERDKGIYDAMNKGIDLAEGDWIYFLGSDDTLYNDDVLKIVSDKANNTDAEVIYGNVLMRGKNQWNLDKVVFDGEYDIEKVIDRNICHQAIFYHKSVFKKNGYFNIKYITSADFDFNLRSYANSTFAYVDTIIANFFLGGHSTHVEDKEFHNDRGAILMKYFKSRIYTRSFLNARLYIQQAALSAKSPLNIASRMYCLLAYIVLKCRSLIHT